MNQPHTRHFLDKPILRSLFWFLVLPHQAKQFRVRDHEKMVAHGEKVIANPIEFGAEEYWCAMRRLDALGIPRTHDEKILSIVGRINKATNTFDG